MKQTRRKFLVSIRKFLRDIENWSRKITLPGLGGIPIYDIVYMIYKELMRDNISTRANSVAYSLFLAIFPFLIFLFTLLPYIPIPIDYVEILGGYIEGALPDTSAKYLMDIIVGLLEIKRTGLRSVSILLSLFFASSGVLTLMYGFDKSSHKAFNARSYLSMRWIAFLLTLVLTLLLVTSFVLLVLGSFVMDFIQAEFVIDDGTVAILSLAKWIVAILLLYTAISIIYRYGPSYKNRLSFFNTGGIVATIMSIVISIGFSYFVNNFGRYNELYGSIGALIVLLIWLQFNAFAILFGFELNASIIVNQYNGKDENLAVDTF